jgi:hypothetical protein
MKKQITSSVLKSILTSAILVSVLLTSVKGAEKKSGQTTPYELKYVGKIQEQPIFQLDIENAQKEDVYIRIEDEVGNVLYTDKFNEKSFSKKFQFDINAGISTRIKMTLFSKTIKQTQTFEINNIQKIVENVVVTKVN